MLRMISTCTNNVWFFNRGRVAMLQSLHFLKSANSPIRIVCDMTWPHYASHDMTSASGATSAYGTACSALDSCVAWLILSTMLAFNLSCIDNYQTYPAVIRLDAEQGLSIASAGFAISRSLPLTVQAYWCVLFRALSLSIRWGEGVSILFLWPWDYASGADIVLRQDWIQEVSVHCIRSSSSAYSTSNGIMWSLQLPELMNMPETQRDLFLPCYQWLSFITSFDDLCQYWNP